MGAGAGTITEDDVKSMVDEIFADMYAVLIWNDDVTTFEDVIKAVVELFDRTVEEADALAWTVHRSGKALAAVLPKDEAEDGVVALLRRNIQASLEKA